MADPYGSFGLNIASFYGAAQDRAQRERFNDAANALQQQRINLDDRRVGIAEQDADLRKRSDDYRFGLQEDLDEALRLKLDRTIAEEQLGDAYQDYLDSGNFTSERTDSLMNLVRFLPGLGTGIYSAYDSYFRDPALSREDFAEREGINVPTQLDLLEQGRESRINPQALLQLSLFNPYLDATLNSSDEVLIESFFNSGGM